MLSISVGDKVRIIRDVRDGNVADGKIANYDGDFPLVIALNVDGVWLPSQYDYEAYINDAALVQEYPLWSGGPRPDGNKFAMSLDNPRFTLEDGTKIWGAECWWELYDENVPLEESQDALENQLDFLRRLAKQNN